MLRTKPRCKLRSQNRPPLLTRLLVVHNRRRVVLSDDAPCLLLHRLGCQPRLIDELVGELLELRQVLANVSTRLVCLAAKCDGAVDAEVLRRKRDECSSRADSEGAVSCRSLRDAVLVLVLLHLLVAKCGAHAMLQLIVHEATKMLSGMVGNAIGSHEGRDRRGMCR